MQTDVRDHMERSTAHLAVYLILIRDEKVLLLRRFQTGWIDGYYTLPAGHIDKGEQVIQATLREATEECGIHIKEMDAQVVQVMHVYTDKNYIAFFIDAKEWQGEPDITESDKCDDMQWFPLVQLPDKTLELVISALESYKKKVFFSECGW